MGRKGDAVRAGFRFESEFRWSLSPFSNDQILHIYFVPPRLWFCFVEMKLDVVERN